MSMRILFLPKYSRKAASARYRFLQYIPILESSGIECTLSPLFDDAYLEKVFSKGHAGVCDILRAFVKRTMSILSANKYDLVVIHCDVFPYLPPIFERYLALRKINYIYDYDDAIFHAYDKHPNYFVRLLLKNKIKKVIEGATYVIAGSKYLADYAKQFNENVELLPTVIDLEKYKTRKKIYSQPFVVGWIGSPSTSEYLKMIAPALKLFCEQSNSKVVLIGSKQIDLGVPLEIISWSEETEIQQMLHFDVGIMPLPDDPWARGKCGFKLIQYMACELPVIASPVGCNSEIVEEGENGFLATTSSEWLNALLSLYKDDELRKKMGKAGRLKVEEKYCVQVIAPRLVSLLRKAAGFAV